MSLTFHTGPMRSGKSEAAIRLALSRGLAFTDAFTASRGRKVIESRALPRTLTAAPAWEIGKRASNPVVVVDEAQFLSRSIVDTLDRMSERSDIHVHAFGLLTDFRGNLFPASQTLISIADRVRHYRAACWCGKDGVYNAKVIDGRLVTTGPTVSEGEHYAVLCRQHYYMGRVSE